MSFLAEDELLRMDVLTDVDKERTRQNDLWGKQRHDLGDWLKILIEEVGEVAQAMQKEKDWGKETDSNNLYEELIHTAAVALAIAEQVKEAKEKRDFEYLYLIGEVVKHKDAAFSEEFTIVDVCSTDDGFHFMLQGPKPKYTEAFPAKKEKIIRLEGTNL